MEIKVKEISSTNKSVAEIEEMSLEEFNGWIVYLNIQAEELENKK